jgi:hypothetical protein
MINLMFFINFSIFIRQIIELLLIKEQSVTNNIMRNSNILDKYSISIIEFYSPFSIINRFSLQIHFFNLIDFV